MLKKPTKYLVSKKPMKYLAPLILLVVFEAVAVVLWLAKNNTFFLLNFSYIGICISTGMFLYAKNFKGARRFVQLFVGTYMLVFLGLVCHENMNLEGFWCYLFLGVFQAAVIHYCVAKIFGPLFFGRGWCGYACWTAMILDFLPFKTPEHERKKFGWIRYITFALSLIFVAALFLLKVENIDEVMFWAFIVVNVLYYALGITLAYLLRDNRAFCKYICPVTVFLKPMSYFSLLRVKCKPDGCIECERCKRACPMDVDCMSNDRNRLNATECIMCMECVRACPMQKNGR